ncbi:hypothetical protein [Nocardia amikacinitolerans]|uniref:hypothetical protein n=1 Tax=Nocardia amikacinitolerans TaxID=756689 RepID=UPI0020A280FD|nr:hypothetical protein [Nocardia amikacinitolerans]MCP2277107.1 hypothetical protein [Nocardia amikacinitolerans]
MGVQDGFAQQYKGSSVDEILDAGAPGLQYWIQLAPRYSRAFGGDDGKTHSFLEMRYDEQRGMNLAKLEAAADGINKMLTNADAQWDIQDQLAKKLPSLWQGAAADAGIAMLSQQVTLAAEDRRKVRAAMDAMRATIGPFRDAVLAKAEFTLKLLKGEKDVKVQGKTPEDIDNIISGAQSGALTNPIFGGSTLIGKLTKIFPDLSPTNSPLNAIQAGLSAVPLISALQGDLTWPWQLGEDSAYNHKIQTRCRDWLNDIFKVEYDEALQKFIEQCDITHQAFETQYTSLESALKQIDDDPYPAPAGEKKVETPSTPGPPGPPGPSTPGPSTPGTPGPGDDTKTDDTTKPSNTTNPLEGLATLAQSLSPLTTTLAQGLGTGLSALSGIVQDGVDTALEQLEEVTKQAEEDAKDEENKDDKAKAEFDLGDKHLKFEMGPDGQLKLIATDPDGTSHEYSMKLDENGIPVISDSEQKPDEAEPPAPEGKPSDGGQTPEGGTGNPGTTSPMPPAAKREEDGEYQPEPIPAPVVEEDSEEQEEPFDTGAQLAEAGPL